MNAEEKTNNVVQFPSRASHEEALTLQAPHEDCAVCGSGKVKVRWKKISFEHGTGKLAATIHANIPVHMCLDCDFKFTGPLADRICHEEVCRHLKVPSPMRPEKLLALRKKLRLTQEQLAKVTGIGVASINRWEKGSFPQSPAMDGYLFLVGLEGNLQALLSRQQETVNAVPFQEKFKLLKFKEGEIESQKKYSIL